MVSFGLNDGGIASEIIEALSKIKMMCLYILNPSFFLHIKHTFVSAMSTLTGLCGPYKHRPVQSVGKTTSSSTDTASTALLFFSSPPFH